MLVIYVTLTLTLTLLTSRRLKTEYLETANSLVLVIY